MSAIHQSSGDLIADRRYEWARGLIEAGDHAAAADLLAEVVALAPGFAAAWFALGEMRETVDDTAGAVAAFEKARAADPRDAHGAAMRLARLGALPAGAMPEGYVQSLFDGYAAKFDTSLTEHLSYRGPQLLLDALRRASVSVSFDNALDLGCGTGLAGELFRPLCARLVGVDLSPGMLAVARGKKLYDELATAEAMGYLRDANEDAFDLVLAADVFAYFHELTPLGPALARVLKPGGLVAFSVETHDGDGVILRDTLRYAHSAAHVRAAMDGLAIVSIEPASTRTEKNVPVPGLIVVAKKEGA